MELIGTGILLAIGFYLAPLVMAIVVGSIGAIFGGIASLFK